MAIGNEWRDRPTCTWPNWHSWEAYLRISCECGVADACAEWISDHGKRPTKENLDGLRWLLSDWLAEVEPGIDQDKVDWKRIYKAMAEYA